jgi:hypothetical protein
MTSVQRFQLESRPPARMLSPHASASAAKKSSAKGRKAVKRERSRSRSRSRSPPASSAAAASPASSSILSRLADHERAARAAVTLVADDEPPFVLHDGSPTSDAASGLIVAIPTAINRRLRPYQREGVAWLFACWRRHEGGILGDEMGLGKTIQVRRERT